MQLLILILLSMALMGCPKTCPSTALPIEPPPQMHVINFDPLAEFCISDENRRLVLEDIQQWRGALMRCNATISTYNEGIK